MRLQAWVIVIAIGFLTATLAIFISLLGARTEAPNAFSYGTTTEKNVLTYYLVIFALAGSCSLYTIQRGIFDHGWRIGFAQFMCVLSIIAAAVTLGATPQPWGWILVGLEVAVPTVIALWQLNRRRDLPIAIHT